MITINCDKYVLMIKINSDITQKMYYVFEILRMCLKIF